MSNPPDVPNTSIVAPPYGPVPTQHDYQLAYDSQSACNLSGIVHSLGEILPRIWNEARREGKGTNYVNKHPITRLFAEQILHLATVGDDLAESYTDAYAVCRTKAKEASNDR